METNLIWKLPLGFLAICAFIISGVSFADENCIQHDKIVESAEAGDQSAQYELGKWNYFGICVEQDFETGIYWYFLAAENGSVGAQYSLGLAFAAGQSVKANQKLAMLFLRRASDGGHNLSTSALANMYLENFSSCDDLQVAQKYISKIVGTSAEQYVNVSLYEELQEACAVNDGEG
jgi:TPR repeat protein